MARLALPFLAFCVVWVPLTWFSGNIVSRDIGTAVYYFGVSYGFIVVAFFLWRKAARDMLDPAKNYVDLYEDRLVMTFSGIRRPIQVWYSNVSAAARLRAWSGFPALLIQRVSPTPPPVRLTLKAVDLWLTFSLLGGLNSVRLEPFDPESFATALSERLARFGIDTHALE